MKNFSFSLDKVLSFKKQVESSVRNEHAIAAREVFAQETFIEELEVEHERQIEAFRKEQIAGCDVARFRSYEDYLSLAQQRINREMDVLKGLREIEVEKRQKVIEAKTETSSLEKLKGKKREEYDKMVQKVEEQFIDEFVSNTMSTIKRE